MANPVDRPRSAPKTVYVQLLDNGEPERCIECTKIVAGKAFAEISGSPFSKIVKPLCSLECFQKYYYTPPSEAPTIPKLKLPIKPPLPSEALGKSFNAKKK